MTISLTERDPDTCARATAARDTQRLRVVLRLNAMLSVIGGIVAIAAAGWLDEQMEVEAVWWARGAGLALVGWASGLVVLAGADRSRLLAIAPAVCVCDLLWVVASVVLAAGGVFDLSGAVLVGVVAIAVGDLAVVQHVLWSRARHERQVSGERTEWITWRSALDVPSSVAWRLVTDHELYGRIAPNLARVEVTGGEGATMCRSCTDRRGRTWSESCSAWHEGVAYEVRVDARTHPEPLHDLRAAFVVSAPPRVAAPGF